MNITVYSKDNCIWCDRAKNLLNSVNFEFDEIDLSNDEERQEFYKRVGEGVSTVPQIYIDNISCLLYTSPSPRDRVRSRMPSSA